MTGRLLFGCLLLVSVLLTGGRVVGAETLPPHVQSAWENAAACSDAGERAARLSEAFLDTPYCADTLGGGPRLPEQLTVRFDAVDCFTLLDTVEALRRSTSPAEFRQRLVEVRYRDSMIAWDHRRHFFTDWVATPGGQIIDLTGKIGGKSAKRVLKQLNRKADGSLHLPGVAVQERNVRFIPTAAIDAPVLKRLRSGDYLGIYTDAAGLDVTHVGIVIRREGQLFLRHASSPRAAGKVIDSDLRAYLEGKPGIIVLRPVAP